MRDVSLLVAAGRQAAGIEDYTAATLIRRECEELGSARFIELRRRAGANRNALSRRAEVQGGSCEPPPTRTGLQTDARYLGMERGIAQLGAAPAFGFKPKLSIQLLGATTRTALPKLKAVLTARAGDANIGRAQGDSASVGPCSSRLASGWLTRGLFNAGGGNGEQCPKASVYGKAKAFSPLLDEIVSGSCFCVPPTRTARHGGGSALAPSHCRRLDRSLMTATSAAPSKGCPTSPV